MRSRAVVATGTAAPRLLLPASAASASAAAAFTQSRLALAVALVRASAFLASRRNPNPIPKPPLIQPRPTRFLPGGPPAAAPGLAPPPTPPQPTSAAYNSFSTFIKILPSPFTPQVTYVASSDSLLHPRPPLLCRPLHSFRSSPSSYPFSPHCPSPPSSSSSSSSSTFSSLPAAVPFPSSSVLTSSSLKSSPSCAVPLLTAPSLVAVGSELETVAAAPGAASAERPTSGEVVAAAGSAAMPESSGCFCYLHRCCSSCSSGSFDGVGCSGGGNHSTARKDWSALLSGEDVKALTMPRNFRAQASDPGAPSDRCSWLGRLAVEPLYAAQSHLQLLPSQIPLPRPVRALARPLQHDELSQVVACGAWQGMRSIGLGVGVCVRQLATTTMMSQHQQQHQQQEEEEEERLQVHEHGDQPQLWHEQQQRQQRQRRGQRQLQRSDSYCTHPAVVQQLQVLPPTPSPSLLPLSPSPLPPSPSLSPLQPSPLPLRPQQPQQQGLLVQLQDANSTGVSEASAHVAPLLAEPPQYLRSRTNWRRSRGGGRSWKEGRGDVSGGSSGSDSISRGDHSGESASAIGGWGELREGAGAGELRGVAEVEGMEGVGERDDEVGARLARLQNSWNRWLVWLERERRESEIAGARDSGSDIADDVSDGDSEEQPRGRRRLTLAAMRWRRRLANPEEWLATRRKRSKWPLSEEEMEALIDRLCMPESASRIGRRVRQKESACTGLDVEESASSSLEPEKAQGLLSPASSASSLLLSPTARSRKRAANLEPGDTQEQPLSSTVGDAGSSSSSSISTRSRSSSRAKGGVVSKDEAAMRLRVQFNVEAVIRELGADSAGSIELVFRRNAPLLHMVWVHATLRQKKRQFAAVGLPPKLLLRVCEHTPVLMLPLRHLTSLMVSLLSPLPRAARRRGGGGGSSGTGVGSSSGGSSKSRGRSKSSQDALTRADVAALMWSRPFTVLLSDPRSLRRRLEGLAECGLAPLGRVLRCAPQLLHYEPEQVQSRLKELQQALDWHLGAGTLSAVEVVVRHPHILHARPATLHSVVRVLHNAFGHEGAARALKVQPALLTGRPQTMELAFELLADVLGSRVAAVQLLLRHPGPLLLRQETLARKLVLLLKLMGRRPEEVVACPAVLMRNVATMHSRWMKLSEKWPELARRVSLSTLFGLSPTRFERLLESGTLGEGRLLMGHDDTTVERIASRDEHTACGLARAEGGVDVLDVSEDASG